MSNKLGGIEGISVIFDVDTEQGQKNIRGLTQAFTEAEIAAKHAETAGQKFSDIIGGIGKIATGAFSMVTAILKAPIDLDNYMGNLNQKVTQIGGNLDKYKNILLELMNKGTFKSGEGGFGLEDEHYKKLMMQFTTGTAAVEKYGAAAAANMKGYTGGAGMMMKTLGFSPEQAGAALTDLHKTAGLTFEKMEPFARQLGAIGKSANLSSNQMSNLVGQVTKLSKAYGMGATQAQRFILDSVQVGAAISQMGMNVQDTIAKMNQVSEGTEEGLIQSLLLGFKPGDAKGQLAAFQNQAKMIVARATSAGEQMAPFVIRHMADFMGMKGFSVEQIQRMSSGAMVEGTEGAKQQDATDILKDILEETKKTSAEAPYVAIAQQSNMAINDLQRTLVQQFDRALKDLKDWIGEIPGYIKKVSGWIDEVKKFFGIQEVTLKHLAIGAGGFVALPKLIGAIPSAIYQIGKWLLAGKAGGAAGEAAGGFLGGLKNFALGGTTLLRATGLGTIAYGVGKLVEAGMDKYGEHINNVAEAGIADANKKRTDMLTAAMKAGGERGERARAIIENSAGKFGSGLSNLKGFAAKHNLEITDVDTPGVHKPNSLHYSGEAIDVRTRHMSQNQIDATKAEITKAGYYYVDETKTSSPHLHISSVPEPSSKAGKLAQTATSKDQLNTVHDPSAVAILVSIRDLLNSHLNGRVALAGSPTSNHESERLLNSWMGNR